VDTAVHKSPAAAEEVHTMPNLDSFAAKLNNFAVVLSEKSKCRPVTVGSVAEVEAAVDVNKVLTASVCLSVCPSVCYTHSLSVYLTDV